MATKPAVSTRRRGRPSARVTRELTGHILAVAQHRFMEVGYEATSIDDIIERASVSNQTFYNRFENKAHLFGEVLQSYARSVLDERRRLDPDLLNLPVEEALYRFAERFLTQNLTNDFPQFERLFVSSVSQFPPIADIVRSAIDELRQMVSTLLADFLSRREFATDDLARSARWFIDGALAPRLRRTSLGLAGRNLTSDDLHELRAYVCFYVRSHARAG